MRSKNPSFENSLACLQHPLTLLSIAVLLLNDHVLKVISPSWLTGKLSDFAGLFFFPFILAAGLSLVFSKFDLSHQRIGQIAFGMVAIWFVFLKTTPFVNLLTAHLASLFIGAPTQLILDPTDLVALMVLLPAWRLWQKQTNIVVLRKAYISLTIGVIACLATSPKAPPFDSVIALAYKEGCLYAESENAFYVVKSLDMGTTWKSLGYQKDDIELIDDILMNHELPIQVCDSYLPQSCYMVDGTDKVYKSSDGGRSWQTAWEVPPERREYMSRTFGEFTSHDIIIIQERGLQYLFVAMGRNGILRRQLPNGDWIQLGVEEAQPAPFFAPDLPSAMNATRKELIVWLGVAFLAILIIHVAIWSCAKGEKKILNLIDWLSLTIVLTVGFILLELVLAFVIFLLIVATSIISNFPNTIVDMLTKPAIAFAIFAPFVLLLFRTNKWLAKMVPDLNQRLRMLMYCALTAIGVLLIGALPWPLWALGVIERYQWALILSISISILITTLGYCLIRRTGITDG